MLRRHIACQQGGQAARPVRNKCRDHAAQRPYVRLHPLAYVMGNKPRCSIGSPPERGAQAHMIKPRHVSVSDPCLGQGIPYPGTLLWVAWTLLGGIRTPSKGPGTLTWESRTVFGGPGCAYRGLVLPRGGPVQLIASWDISSFLATWRPWSRSRGGSGAVHRAARDCRMGTVPSYYSNGYP
jgi:hypothetical protein